MASGFTNPSYNVRGTPAFFEQEPVKQAPPSVRTKLKFMVLGVFVFCMLCSIPLWNAILLLNNASYVYFEGTVLPNAIIGVCVGVVCFFLLVTPLLFCLTPAEAQTNQMFVLVAVFCAALLGICFLCLEPPTTELDTTYEDLLGNCMYGFRTRDVYKEYETLFAVRMEPSCAVEPTIEDCSDYNETTLSLLIKEMELTFKCSGFCFSSNTSANVTNETNNTMAFTAAASPGAVSLLAGKTSVRGGEASRVVARSTTAVSSGLLVLPYPNTLFSQANYQCSCDGMAARNLQDGGGLVLAQVTWEGVMLIFISVLVSFLLLLGQCSGRDNQRGRAAKERAHLDSIAIAQEAQARYGSVPPSTRAYDNSVTIL